MKQLLKRSISAVLVAALTFGLFFPFGNSTTSQAASTIPAFLYSGVYGSGGAGSKSGWGTSSSVSAPFSSSHGSLYGLAVKSGSTYRLGYCMGYGLSLHSSDSIAQKGTVYTSNNHGQTWSALSDWKKQYVNLAITYGLNDVKASHTAKGIQSLIKSNRSLYGATQVMVWSVVHAKSKENFASSKYRNPIRNRYLKSDDRNKYDELYDAMVNAYKGAIPSMTKTTEANAKADPLVMKGNNANVDSTVSIKDANGILKHGKGNKYSYSEITKIKAVGSTSASKLKATIDRSSGSLKCTLPKGSISSEKAYTSFLLTLKTYYGKYDDIKKYSTTTDSPKVVSYQKSGKGQALAVHNTKLKTKTSYVTVFAEREEQDTAALTIKKTSSDGKVDGFRFYIRKNLSDTENYTKGEPTLYAKEICTDGVGNAAIKDISPGVYDVWEVGYGYAKYSQGSFDTPEAEINQTYLNKYQSAILSLYDKTATTTKAFNDDTGATMSVTNKNINITKAENANGGESGIFEKYNQGHIKIVVEKGSDTLLYIHNERKTNSININKVYDKDKDDIYGYGSQAVNEGDIFELKAAVEASSLWKSFPAALRTAFGLGYYYDNTPVSTMVIDSNKKGIGQEFNVLPDINADGAAYATNDGTNKPLKSASGKITETYCSQGSKKYSISNDGVVDMRSLNTITLTAVNKPDSDYLYILKMDESTHEPVRMSGFGFEIIDANTGLPLKNSDGNSVFYTNEEGKAFFCNYTLSKTDTPENIEKLKVPYGTYIVKEVVAPSPYILSEKTFFFTINPNGSELYTDGELPDDIDDGLIEDTPAEEEEVIEDIPEDPALGGAEVSEDTSGTGGEETVTDAEEGTATNTTVNDINENYEEEYDASLEDEAASYGGLSPAEKILVKVQNFINETASANVKTTGSNTEVSFGFENTEQLGAVVVYKTGTSYTKSGKKVSIKNTKYGKEFTLKSTLADLSDVEFTIYADGDIVSGTGKTLYKDGETVGIMYTNEEGKASFEGLHVGSYILQETATRKGYILPEKGTRFRIEHEGQNVVKEFSFNNDAQTMKVSVYKKMEDYSTYNDAYKSVLFGLYTKKPISDDDGSILVPANALVDTTGVKPEKDYFVGNFKKSLPYGSYYVKEINTDSRYMIDKMEYPVDFQWIDYKTKEVAIHVNMDNGGFLYNYLKPVGKLTSSYTEDSPKDKQKTAVRKRTTTTQSSAPETGDGTPLALYWIFLIGASLPLVGILLHSAGKKVSGRRKKKKESFFLLLLAFSLIAASTVKITASAEAAGSGKDSFTREVVYNTELADYTKGLPKDAFQKEIVRGGATYQLDTADISYQVDSASPQYETVVTTHKETKSGLSSKNYKPAQTVQTVDKQGNPVTVYLQNVSFHPVTVPVEQKVSTSTNYGYQISKPVISRTKKTTVKNKINGKTETVTCSLTEVKQSKTTWREDKSSPIMVEGYGSSSYRLGNTILSANNLEDLGKSGDIILNYLGLSPDFYKITKVKWDGGPYDQTVSGKKIRCRKATAMISRKVAKYTAKYSAVISTPTTLYTATANYKGSNRVQKSTLYTITAKARYVAIVLPVTPAPAAPTPVPEDRGSNIPIVVGITLGVLIACIGVIALMYFLSKKKKERMNGYEKRI